MGRGDLHDLLKIAHDIEAKEDERLEELARKTLEENAEKLETKMELSMERLEEVLKSETLYMKKITLSKDKRTLIGSYVIRVDDNEELKDYVELFASRDLNGSVKEIGVIQLMKTLARNYTYLGYDVFIDGKVFNPDML